MIHQPSDSEQVRWTPGAKPSANGSWVHVSPSHPCPICGKPDWCSTTADGEVIACRRVDAGSYKTKQDRNGAPVYLHRGVGCPPRRPPPQRPGPGVRRAEPDTLDRVYRALLGELLLSDAHRAALHRRGLTDEVINRNGYRTLPVQGRAQLACRLSERFGDGVLSVPGLVVKDGGKGTYLTIAGAAGLLVPVRDPTGRVVALLVRRDEVPEEGGKYTWISSVKNGGPGPGSPAHVPLACRRGVSSDASRLGADEAEPAFVVRLTEGALKADVATALSGMATVGAPGLNWRACLPALRELGARNARLAFDADAFTNANVRRALFNAARGLQEEGFAPVEVEQWPAEHGKGVDDVLAAGHQTEVLTGTELALALGERGSAAGDAGTRDGQGGGPGGRRHRRRGGHQHITLTCRLEVR